MQSAVRQLSAPAPRSVVPRSRSSVAVNARAVQFRPCIDIHKGKVKQIVGSTLQDLASGGDEQLKTNFESEHPSSWFAELYQRDALTGGHVIMLGADEDSKAAAFGALQAYPGGLQLGGGVTTENAAEYLEAGASHVIVTSFVFRDGRLEEGRLADLVKLVGKQRLVLDLSCRKKDDGQYYVVTDRWQKFSTLALSEATLAYLAESCDEFLVHGVDVEGMQLGIDDELVQLLGAWSPIPVTYAGGARTLEDLERVRRAGSGRVDITVGSALDVFGGQLPYADVVAWHKEQQQAAATAAAFPAARPPPAAAPPAPPAAAAAAPPAADTAPAAPPAVEPPSPPAPPQQARRVSSTKALGEQQQDGSVMFRDIRNTPLGEIQSDGTVMFWFE